MCAVDHDGRQVNTDKHMWYQGRGMWTHAFVYNHFGGEIHLEMARKTRDFILRHGMDGDGNWVRTLDREGRQIGATDRMGYTALFIAEGLQEYARAAGDEESMELAIESYWKGARLYDDPQRDVGQGYLPVSYPGIRLQGFEMVTIVLLTQLLQKRADPKLEARLAHSVEVVMERFWNPEYRLNNEALNHDYERPDDDNEDHVYLGHAIETFWMILHEALRRGDRPLFYLAAERMKRHMEVAWTTSTAVSSGPWRSTGPSPSTRSFGSRGGPHRHDDPPGAHRPAVARSVVRPHLSLRSSEVPAQTPRLSMWIMGGDRKVTFRPHTSRKGNYHHPRHLMLNLLALDRMIERGGRVSGVWQ